MLNFLDDELDDQKRITFQKIVSRHFASKAESGDSADLVRRVIAWVEADARAAAEPNGGDGSDN